MFSNPSFKCLGFILLALIFCLSTWYIFNGSDHWLIILSSIADGVTLFVLKKTSAVAYGAAELLIALIAIADASTKGRGAFSSGFSDAFDIGDWRIVLLQTAAAIYILISGLENIWPFLKRIFNYSGK
jgi:hypothetical protein